tara:strand:- start:8826 stop:9011 length:186 start_codon:yes stop_codon:yes gene_type:complete
MIPSYAITYTYNGITEVIDVAQVKFEAEKLYKEYKFAYANIGGEINYIKGAKCIGEIIKNK